MFYRYNEASELAPAAGGAVATRADMIQEVPSSKLASHAYVNVNKATNLFNAIARVRKPLLHSAIPVHFSHSFPRTTQPYECFSETESRHEFSVSTVYSHDLAQGGDGNKGTEPLDGGTRLESYRPVVALRSR